MNRAERHTLFQAQMAGIRADLAIARNNLAGANNPLLRASDRQTNLQRATDGFSRVQGAVRELQANPNLTRNERLELSRLTRDRDFTSMQGALHETQFQLSLDEAVRTL